MNEFIQSIQTLLLYNAQYKLKVRLYLAVKQSIQILQWGRDLKCPSSRFLSENLGISRDTVEKTYQQLEQEGWLYRIKGKGTFIKVNARRKIELNTSTTLPAVSYVLPESQQRLQALFFDQNLHFFADGMPEIRHFPFRKWYEAEKEVLTQDGLKVFLKDNSCGHAVLRHEIAQMTNLNRHTQINAENVLIVSSTQQALYLCGRILLKPNDHILMENPFYSNAKQLFEMMETHIQYADVDQYGIQLQDLDYLKTIDLKAIYVTPANQFPTGVQMSLERRQQLIALAQQTGAYILEDDYDAFLLGQQQQPAILGLNHQHTIYLGSLSKYILPSLKLSYLILPNALIEPFKHYRNYIEGSAPSHYTQAILAQFMQKGDYADYLADMQALYLGRYQSFMVLFDQYLSEYCEIREPRPCMQMACYFKGNIPIKLEQALVEGAALQQISLTALSQFYAKKFQYGFILGFSALNHTEIQLCMIQLSTLIQHELKRLGES